MPTLILLRHGQSQWNLENRFTGWVDIDLSDAGRQEAQQAGEKLLGMKIDRVYTSRLMRAINTAKIALEAAGMQQLPTIEDQALNERHYGDLQGLNKAETAAKYGDEQVHIWRRSFDVPPPGPEAESLELCMKRVMPYYQQHILPDLRPWRAGEMKNQKCGMARTRTRARSSGRWISAIRTRPTSSRSSRASPTRAS